MRDDRSSGDTSSRLHLRASAIQIPHPGKIEHGGEDSYFVCEDGTAVGVADGGSYWGWRFGLNPRAFADELMHSVCREIQQSAPSEEIPSAASRAQKALSDGFDSVEAFGAATALVVTLDDEGSKLGVAALGDSGLRQLRRMPSTRRFKVVGCTSEGLHNLNEPFQLTHLPHRADFPRLCAEGKSALIQAVKRRRPQKFESPSAAAVYSLDIQEGDLIILGSDGVFNNLHDSEICDIVDEKSSGAQRGAIYSERVARAIAEAAASRSRESDADTPFSQRARESGSELWGGIKDDITVIAAWIAY